jgi:ribonuclease HI
MKSTPRAALDVLLHWTPLHLKLEEVATKAAFRLAATNLWEDPYKLSGHTDLNRKLNKGENYWRNSDRIIPRFEFDHNFGVVIANRQDVDLCDYEEGESKILCFTDGSKSDFGTGAGIFVAKRNIEISVNVGQNATVFQSEVKAIEFCAKELIERGVSNEVIHICSDSKAALFALDSFRVRSKTIWECLQVLQCLGALNDLTLLWVPGHCDIAGNESADQLAKKGLEQPNFELTLPISHCVVKARVEFEIEKCSNDYWRNTSGQLHAKKFIPLRDMKRSRNLLGLNRVSAGRVTRIITGHCRLNYHLDKMGLVQDPLCRFCAEDNETAEHVLCECPALARRREKVWKKLFTTPSDIKDLRKVSSFIKDLKIEI